MKLQKHLDIEFLAKVIYRKHEKNLRKSLLYEQQIHMDPILFYKQIYF